MPAGCGLEIELIVWGHRALDHMAVAVTTARAAFRAVFSVVELDSESIFEGALGAWAERAVPAFARRVLLELVTPCDLGRDGQGQPHPFTLPALVGNMAHDLVQWDLYDRGKPVSKLEADCMADQMRTHVQTMVLTLDVQIAAIEYVNLGLTRSGSSGTRFPLGGYQGYCVLAGPLAPVLPWLAALALRGAGSHKSYGLGHVRLWFLQSSSM